MVWYLYYREKIFFKSKNYTHAEKILHWERQCQCNIHKFLHCSVHSSFIFIVKVCVISNVIFRKLFTWRSQIVNITMIWHPHVNLYHLKALNVKHVEIIKVLDKPTYDTSLESSWLGDHRVWISPWYDILMCNCFISNLKTLNM